MTILRAISGNGWRLRPEADADAGFLERLFCCLREGEPMLAGWTKAQREVFLRQQFMAQYRHYRSIYGDNGEFWIIDDPESQQPVGRLCLHRGVDQLRIVDIALLPQWHGRGIGTALLRAVIEEACVRSVGIGLHVDPLNPARQLYRRLGFMERHVNGPYLFMSWTAGGDSPERRTLPQYPQVRDRCGSEA